MNLIRPPENLKKVKNLHKFIESHLISNIPQNLVETFKISKVSNFFIEFLVANSSHKLKPVPCVLSDYYSKAYIIRRFGSIWIYIGTYGLLSPLFLYIYFSRYSLKPNVLAFVFDWTEQNKTWRENKNIFSLMQSECYTYSFFKKKGFTNIPRVKVRHDRF